MKRHYQVILALVLFGSAANAAPNDGPILKRGINLSSWYANAPRQPLLERDFAQLEAAGFDHVRLPVNPLLLGFEWQGDAPSDGDFTPIDVAIALAQKHHLAVILDMHPRADFMQTLENEDAAQQRFVALWVMLAKRYRTIPSNQLAFELLNEPQYYNRTHAYETFVQRLVGAIRQVDSTRVIIIGAPRGSSIEGLQALHPVDDPHIIYDVHFYEPYLITHQGIQQGFAKKMIRYFAQLPYPASLAQESASVYAPQASDADEAQDELDEYHEKNWNAERIAKRLHTVREWADAHHVKVMCGEFGVYRNHIYPASRYRWIADVRTALEAEHIVWDLWDYTDSFGITELRGDTITDPNDGSVRLKDVSQGARSIEPAAINALGLKSPHP